MHYFSCKPGEKNDTVEVLLCTPSGKAAYLINGVTVYHAFAQSIRRKNAKFRNGHSKYYTTKTYQSKITDNR